MAVTSTKSGVSIKDDMVHDADVDATVEQNLFGGAGSLYSLTCYFVSDTSDDEVTWIKMADTLSATAGTTNPDIKFPVVEGTFFTMVCVDGFAVSDGMALWGTVTALVDSVANPAGTVKAWAVFR